MDQIYINENELFSISLKNKEIIDSFNEIYSNPQLSELKQIIFTPSYIKMNNDEEIMDF